MHEIWNENESFFNYKSLVVCRRRYSRYHSIVWPFYCCSWLRFVRRGSPTYLVYLKELTGSFSDWLVQSGLDSRLETMILILITLWKNIPASWAKSQNTGYMEDTWRMWFSMSGFPIMFCFSLTGLHYAFCFSEWHKYLRW